MELMQTSLSKETRKTKETVCWSVYWHEGLPFYLGATEQGVCYISLGNETLEDGFRWIKKRIPSAVFVKDDLAASIEHTSYAADNVGTTCSSVLSSCRSQLREYFEGVRRTFTLPMDLRGTPFQRAVWQALTEIPFGQTCSYSDIGHKLGRKTGFRAIGSAIGANPLAIVVPCHRVIGKDGSLTGFGGGMKLKADLLALEGVALA